MNEPKDGKQYEPQTTQLSDSEKFIQREALVQEMKNFNSNGSYYELFGVATTATNEEIKAAYRAKAKKFHPDNLARIGIVDAALLAQGESIIKKLNEAYDVLMDPAQRSEYTKKISTPTIENLATEALLKEFEATREIEKLVEILKELVRREYVFTYSVTYSGVTFPGKKISAQDLSQLIVDAVNNMDASEFTLGVSLRKIPPVLGIDQKIKWSVLFGAAEGRRKK